MSFADRLAAAQRQHLSTLAIGFAPSIMKLPNSLQRYDDPLLPFGKAIIDVTADQVCAYVFHLSAYLAFGASGAIALERTIAYVPQPILKILHGPFASSEYARAAFEDAFAADAVTLSATLDADRIGAYTQQTNHAVFVESDGATVDRLHDQFTALQPIAAQNLGQVGTYRQAAPGHYLLTLLSEPALDLHWYWQEAIYVTQNDNYREAIQRAATGLRQPPTI